MAQKSEKLSQEVIDKLSGLQSKINDLVFNIGQISLQLRDLKEELKKGEEMKLSIETEFDKVNNEFSDTLKELEKTYPKGEIDLKEGMVYFETEE